MFSPFYYGGGEGGQESETPQKPRYKGALSIGIDEVSNTVIVSAPPTLMAEIKKMIEDLDEAAAPVDAVQVLKLGPGVSPAKIEAALSEIVGNGKKAAAQAKPGDQKPEQGKKGGRNRRGQQGNGQAGQTPGQGP